MRVTAVLLSILAISLAQQTQCPSSSYKITNDETYQAVASCPSLDLSEITGTTVDLVFNSLTTLQNPLTVTELGGSTTLSMPALTSSQGIIIQSTSLTSVEIGSPDNTNTNNGGVTITENNADNLAVTLNMQTSGLVTLTNNGGLTSFALTGTNTGLSASGNNALQSITFTGVTSVSDFSVTSNPGLETLQFLNTSGVTAAKFVSIQDAQLNVFTAPFTSIGGDFTLINNAGSFAYAGPSSTAITGAVSVSANDGLTSFTFNPTSTSSGAFSALNNQALTTLNIGSTTTPAYSPSTVTFSDSAVGLIVNFGVVQTGLITISKSDASNSNFVAVNLAITNSAGSINANGVTITTYTITGISATTTAASIQVNSVTTNKVVIANVATVSGQVQFSTVTSTGSNSSIAISGLRIVGNNLQFTGVSTFNYLNVADLVSVGFITAQAAPFTVNNNIINTAASFTGNYTTNGNVGITSNTGGAAWSFNGLLTLNSLNVNSNAFSTMTFSTLTCADNITTNANSGALISFPALKNVIGGIINNNANLNGLTVSTTTITSGTACYICNGNPGGNSGCSSNSVNSGFKSACTTANGQCPINGNVIVTPTSSPTSSTGSPSTGASTTSTTNTSPTSTGNSATTPVGTVTITDTTTGNGQTTSTVNTATTPAGTTGNPTNSATAVAASLMVVAAVVLSM